jgi:hypothetical protein
MWRDHINSYFLLDFAVYVLFVLFWTWLQELVHSHNEILTIAVTFVVLFLNVCFCVKECGKKLRNGCHKSKSLTHDELSTADKSSTDNRLFNSLKLYYLQFTEKKLPPLSRQVECC